MSSHVGAKRVILSVVGPHSGCGKTTFVIHLLKHVEGLGTLKISPASEWPDADSVGGRMIGDGFYLEDPAHLDRPGKDTALYTQAGAAQVERLRHQGAMRAVGLEAALCRFPRDMPVVVESSSAVQLLKPVAVILVVRWPLVEMKPTTEAILPKVTDLLINASDREGQAVAAVESLRQEFASLNPQHIWSADLIREPPPPEMLIRLRALLKAGPGADIG